MTGSTASLLLDSSVVVKWFIQEEDSDEALELRDGFLAGRLNLIIPELALYEIANALKFSKLFAADEIKKCVQALLALDIEVLVFDFDCLEEAIELSTERDLAIYDAYFIACAKYNNLIFISADERALKKIDDFEFALSLSESADHLGC